ncbi:DegV family protein [Shouchella sp. JSM 1781072]|uniref:DegV family protein n=1 Tax=Bacillaceae TaxID=186817 RepID=UPI000C087C69|nr:DegV family protein [Bacillus sp. Marseille-P3800]
MTKIKIVTDSTCDIESSILQELGVTVVPLSININGKSYLDGVDISKKEFAHLLVTNEELPKSSQPPVGEFVRIYEELLDEPDTHVLSIHMTSAMSGTVASAQMAADELNGRVTVVDSCFISIALSFQVKRAAELANKGASLDSILNEIADIRSKTSLYIVVDTLEYLAKGGRIGKGKALLGSLLKIKPIASLQDGSYTPVTTKRSQKQVLDFLSETFEKETDSKDVEHVGIAHIEAESFSEQVMERLKKVRQHFSSSILETSPIISTHTGPGAIALMYYTK